MAKEISLADFDCILEVKDPFFVSKDKIYQAAVSACDNYQKDQYDGVCRDVETVLELMLKYIYTSYISEKGKDHLVDLIDDEKLKDLLNNHSENRNLFTTIRTAGNISKHDINLKADRNNATVAIYGLAGALPDLCGFLSNPGPGVHRVVRTGTNENGASPIIDGYAKIVKAKASGKPALQLIHQNGAKLNNKEYYWCVSDTKPNTYASYHKETAVLSLDRAYIGKNVYAYISAAGIRGKLEATYGPVTDDDFLLDIKGTVELEPVNSEGKIYLHANYLSNNKEEIHPEYRWYVNDEITGEGDALFFVTENFTGKNIICMVRSEGLAGSVKSYPFLVNKELFTDAPNSKDDGSLKDYRVPLSPGYKLTIIDKKNNKEEITIEKEVGRGASCIVYQGQKNLETDAAQIPRKVIVKEFYPFKEAVYIKREQSDDPSKNMMLQLPYNGDDSLLKRSYEAFQQGISEFTRFASSNSAKSLPPVEFYGKALGTAYAVSGIREGTTLSRIDRKEMTLPRAITLAANICDAIYQVNKTYKAVYLDCKPDNIFVDGDQVFLFDFDTVQKIDRITYTVYTKGWSAPEQEPAQNGYKNASKIGYHTDIYMIGNVFYYLLTGAPAKEKDIQNIQKNTRWTRQISVEDPAELLKNKGFTEELTRIMRKVLQPDVDTRRTDYPDSDAAKKLKNELKNLLNTAENIPRQADVKALEGKLESTKGELSESISKLSERINAQSLKNILFGSRKNTLRTVISLVFLSFIITLFAALGSAVGSSGSATNRNLGDAAQGTGAMSDGYINEQMVSLEKELDPDNAAHDYAVGVQYFDEGNYQKAAEYFTYAVKEQAGVTGEDSVETAKIYVQLGYALLYSNQAEKAAEVITNAIAALKDEEYREQRGWAYLARSRAYLILYETTYEKRYLNRMEADLDSILEIDPSEQLDAYRYEWLGIVSFYKAMLNEKDQNSEIAESLFDLDQALFLKNNTYALSYPNAANLVPIQYYSMANLAELGLADGYIRGDDRDNALILTNRAQTLMFIGSYDLAEQDCLTALEIYNNLPASKQVGMSFVYRKLTIMAMQKKDYDSALDYSSKALESDLTWYGPDHAITAYSYEYLGASYQAQLEYEKALDAHYEAYRIGKVNGSKDTMDFNYERMETIYTKYMEHSQRKFKQWLEDKNK